MVVIVSKVFFFGIHIDFVVFFDLDLCARRTREPAGAEEWLQVSSFLDVRAVRWPGDRVAPRQPRLPVLPAHGTRASGTG